MRCISLLVLTIEFAVGASGYQSSTNVFSSVADCNVVPISVRGGTGSLRQDPLRAPVGLVVIQHTVTTECTTGLECECRVKGIRKFHIVERSFTDIGYSFIIGGNGKIYDGAGWHFVGAHTRGYNNRSIGISFIGDFRKKLPNSKALSAAKELLNCGVKNKHLSEKYHIVGHKQLSDTESPGIVLQTHIETWPYWLKNAKEIAK